MKSISPSEAILERCATLDLPLWQAEELAVESGYPGQEAVCWVLGLDTKKLDVIKPRNWTMMAARTSSVSYREVLTPELLAAMLTTGIMLERFVPHLLHLVDEAPTQILVMTAEEISRQSGRPICTIWQNIENFAIAINARRRHAWTRTRSES
jgi:hypothetical protein